MPYPDGGDGAKRTLDVVRHSIFIICYLGNIFGLSCRYAFGYVHCTILHKLLMPTFIYSHSPCPHTYFYIFEDSWQSANRRTLENKCGGYRQSVRLSVIQSSFVIFACLHLIIESHAVAVACHAHSSGGRPQPPFRPTFALFAFAGSYSSLIRFFYPTNIIFILLLELKTSNKKKRAARGIWIIQINLT